MPTEWADEELVKSTAEGVEPRSSRRRATAWLLAAVLLVGGAIALYVAFGRGDSSETSAAATAPAAAPAPAAVPVDRGLGRNPLAVVVPPIDESDTIVGQLVKELSSHPSIAAWLATRGLIRNFTAVVANVAEGRRPAGLVPALRPSSGFAVIQRGSVIYIDPKSYQRYTPLAQAAASVDPTGSSRLYATLKPRIEEAYRDLGDKEPLFDRKLERALVLLIGTPIPNDPIAVVPKGIGYAFADSRLENLTAAQKQLLRMGPENARTIQRSLREIALALGIPPERLPDDN